MSGNTPNLRTNSKDLANKEGGERGIEKSQNRVDIINGSPNPDVLSVLTSSAKSNAIFLPFSAESGRAGRGCN